MNWADDEAYLAMVPAHAKSCAATNRWEKVRLEAKELSQPFCSLSAHFLLTFRSRFAHLLLTFRSPFAQDQLDEVARGLICFGTLYWRHAEGGGNRLVDVFMLLLLPLVAYLLGMDDAESLGISVLVAIGSSLPDSSLYVLGHTLLEMLPRTSESEEEEEEKEDILRMTVAELKVVLSAVGAPTTGKKQALAARLTALRAAE